MDVVSVSGPVRSPRCPCRTVLADSEPSRAAAVMCGRCVVVEAAGLRAGGCGRLCGPSHGGSGDGCVDTHGGDGDTGLE